MKHMTTEHTDLCNEAEELVWSIACWEAAWSGGCSTTPQIGDLFLRALGLEGLATYSGLEHTEAVLTAYPWSVRSWGTRATALVALAASALEHAGRPHAHLSALSTRMHLAGLVETRKEPW